MKSILKTLRHTSVLSSAVAACLAAPIYFYTPVAIAASSSTNGEQPCVPGSENWPACKPVTPPISTTTEESANTAIDTSVQTTVSTETSTTAKPIAGTDDTTTTPDKPAEVADEPITPAKPVARKPFTPEKPEAGKPLPPKKHTGMDGEPGIHQIVQDPGQRRPVAAWGNSDNSEKSKGKHPDSKEDSDKSSDKHGMRDTPAKAGERPRVWGADDDGSGKSKDKHSMGKDDFDKFSDEHLSHERDRTPDTTTIIKLYTTAEAKVKETSADVDRANKAIEEAKKAGDKAAIENAERRYKLATEKDFEAKKALTNIEIKAKKVKAEDTEVFRMDGHSLSKRADETKDDVKKRVFVKDLDDTPKSASDFDKSKGAVSSKLRATGVLTTEFATAETKARETSTDVERAHMALDEATKKGDKAAIADAERRYKVAMENDSKAKSALKDIEIRVKEVKTEDAKVFVDERLTSKRTGKTKDDAEKSVLRSDTGTKPTEDKMTLSRVIRGATLTDSETKGVVKGHIAKDKETSFVEVKKAAKPETKFVEVDSYKATFAGTFLTDVADKKVEVIDKHGKARKLGKDSAFYVGDTIKTSSGKALQMRYSDGSLVQLHSDSEYRVDGFHYDGKSESKDRFKATLLKGSFDTLTGEVAASRSDDYEVATKAGSIKGVPSKPGKKTRYTAALETDEKTKKPTLIVQVDEGEVKAVSNTGKGTLIGARKATLMSLASSAAPEVISSTEVARFKSTTESKFAPDVAALEITSTPTLPVTPYVPNNTVVTKQQLTAVSTPVPTIKPAPAPAPQPGPQPQPPCQPPNQC